MSCNVVHKWRRRLEKERREHLVDPVKQSRAVKARAAQLAKCRAETEGVAETGGSNCKRTGLNFTSKALTV